jgi:hypothetical protein
MCGKLSAFLRPSSRALVLLQTDDREASCNQEEISNKSYKKISSLSRCGAEYR